MGILKNYKIFIYNDLQKIIIRLNILYIRGIYTVWHHERVYSIPAKAKKCESRRLFKRRSAAWSSGTARSARRSNTQVQPAFMLRKNYFYTQHVPLNIIPGEVRKCENREAILNTATNCDSYRVEYNLEGQYRRGLLLNQAINLHRGGIKFGDYPGFLWSHRAKKGS